LKAEDPRTTDTEGRTLDGGTSPLLPMRTPGPCRRGRGSWRFV
jgi:hypothetical protein